MKPEENKEVKIKRPYTAPQIGVKPLTGHFMDCANTAGKCPSASILKQRGTCFE